MKKSLPALGALALLALFTAGSAQAITLTDLFNGASVMANNQRFDQWVPLFQDSSDGRTVDTDNIEVNPLTDGDRNPGPGLEFTIRNDELRVTGDDLYAYLDFRFGFRASMLDPKERIDGNAVQLTGVELAWWGDGDNDLGVYLDQWVGAAPGLSDLAMTEATAGVLDDIETAAPFDSAAFPLQGEIFVTTNMLIWARDATDDANLIQFTQRFSQTQIPEPATLLLFGLGLLGMSLVRRRSI